MARYDISRAFQCICIALVAIGLGARGAAAGGGPSHCAKTGTPLQAPVVGGGSFGFSVALDDHAHTVVVGQPDANDGGGLVYAYNNIALCAYQSAELPPPPKPTTKAGGAPPGLLGMMTAMSRDGKWLAVAGTLEQGNTMAQVYIYLRQPNDAFALHQKLSLQPAPTTKASLPPGKVHAGSLSISRDGRLVLVSWSVYGPGQASDASDPYGPPSGDTYGSAQLYRRLPEGMYTRAQADFGRLAPPLARTQFFGANSLIVADGAIAAVSTRIIDKTQPNGSPAIVIYRRTPADTFELLTTLKVPGSDGAFVMTDSGSHLAVARGSDIHIYVREGHLRTGRTVYNKRCTLVGEDMNLEPTFTKLAMTVSRNSTLRLAVGNSLDSVFVWSIPLGGRRAYKDGTCPAALDRTLTGDSNSQFGTSLAISADGRTLAIGVPGSSQNPDTSVLMVDIDLPKPPPSGPPPEMRGLAGYINGGSSGSGVGARTVGGGRGSSAGGTRDTSIAAASVPLDNTYFVTNPSSVLVSARRGSIGVPAPQPFDLSSWASGSPGGAPYNPALGYSIKPDNPYISGGQTQQQGSGALGLLSALGGLGLSTSALRAASLSAG